jgi:hypothetical protein
LIDGDQGLGIRGFSSIQKPVFSFQYGAYLLKTEY